MISINGKTGAGWRMDEVTEHGPVGLEMLANPFAIVPKKENADRIELAFRLLGGLKRRAENRADNTAILAWFQEIEAELAKVVGEE
jgi:hypothetical protein